MYVETVAIGELKLIRDAGKLRAIAIGSCIALCLHDAVYSNGVMGHILLPGLRETSRKPDAPAAYYADTAVSAALEMIINAGSARRNVVAAIVGGAQMFPFGNVPSMNIGKLNVEAVTSQLKRFDIPLVHSDTGGNKARTVEFSLPGKDVAACLAALTK